VIGSDRQEINTHVVYVGVPGQNGDKLKRRQVITVTTKRRQPKRRHIIRSQVETATN